MQFSDSESSRPKNDGHGGRETHSSADDGIELTTRNTDRKPPPPRSLSKLLTELRDQKRETVSIGDLAFALQDRSFGAFMLVFSIPCLLPFPPFTTVFLGLPLIIISWQMMLGRDTVWLPAFITRRSVTGARFEELLGKALPILMRIEKRVRPRYWTLLRNPLILKAAEIFMFLTAVVVVLPIPFGNWLPAFGCAFFGAALSQRDGVWIVIALVTSVIANTIAFGVAILGVEAFNWVLSLV